MQIVIYKAQGKDWQMARAGDSKCPFYTTSQFRYDARFSDGRSASGWLRRCQRYARTVLGWKDAVFKRISEYEFEDSHLHNDQAEARREQPKPMNTPKTIEQRKPAVASSDLLGESGQTKYVVGFMFDASMSHVALIRKNKPAWQAGLLNGIGGKVEPGEEAINAMCREFGEEAGLWPADWTHFCSMAGTNNDGGSFEVECFYTIGEPHKLTSMESEQIEVVSSKAIAGGEEKTIGNLPWLVALALDFDKGVHPPSKVNTLYSPNDEALRPARSNKKDDQ